MDINNVEVLLGLDDIVDYSENFEDGKEDFYDILTMVKENKDIMTIFNTKDGRIGFFTSGKDSSSLEKDFLLFLAPTAADLFVFFHNKYIECTLNGSPDMEMREKECDSIILLTKCLVQLTDLDEDKLLDKLKLINDSDN
jgi:hypothetical protein